MRYHKDVYFPHSKQLLLLVEKLNQTKWNYSQHCIDGLDSRCIDIKQVLTFIRELKLSADDIFEYYTTSNGDFGGVRKAEADQTILQACFRIKYSTTQDLILVVSDKKVIVTVYFNGVNDEHETLNESLYCKGEEKNAIIN